MVVDEEGDDLRKGRVMGGARYICTGALVEAVGLYYRPVLVVLLKFCGRWFGDAIIWPAHGFAGQAARACRQGEERLIVDGSTSWKQELGTLVPNAIRILFFAPACRRAAPG